MKIQFFQPTIWRAGVHASPPATPPSSQALDLHLRLAKHDLWISHIPFTLHYPSATRGGATCYLIKGASSLPPTKKHGELADSIGRFIFKRDRLSRSPSDRRWLFEPGVQVRVGFSCSWNPQKHVSQEAVFTRTDDVTGWPHSWTLDSPPKIKKNKTSNLPPPKKMRICEWTYSAWRHKACI